MDYYEPNIDQVKEDNKRLEAEIKRLNYEKEKSKRTFIRRFLSWLFLTASMIVSMLLGLCVIRAFVFFLEKLKDFSTALFILLVIVCGASLLSLLIMFFVYGITYVVSISEKICPSKNGIRYKIFFFYMIISQIVNMISRFDLKQVYFLLFSVIVLIMTWNIHDDFEVSGDKNA